MMLLSAQAKDIALAATALKKGQLVAIPTETVYGLAGDAFNSQALARIFEAKKRPFFDPLIVHIGNLEHLELVADLTQLSAQQLHNLEHLATTFWPGPLSLVLPKRKEVPELISSGLSTLAVRWPSHPIAQAVIAQAGPLAAPSANPFGYLSPTRAEHVISQLGQNVDYILDGGPCTLGLESTVLDIGGETARILRPGGIAKSDIEACIGPVELIDRLNEQPSAPGQLKSHYAPRRPLILYERGQLHPEQAQSGDALLFFSDVDREQSLKKGPLPAQVSCHVLSPKGDLREATSELFAILHRLDAETQGRIHAERLPDEGLGFAVNDRLQKAQSKNKAYN